MLDDLELTADDVRTVVAAVVSSGLELPVAAVAGAPHRTAIDRTDLGADSLDLLELATQVSNLFRVHESGLEDTLLARRTLGDWVETVLHAFAQGSGRLEFTTSGSTGSPTACSHEWSLLVQEVAEHARLVAPRARVVRTVPPQHIYGFLWTVLLPRLLGVDVLDARAMAPTSILRALRPGDLVVSHPLLWHHLLRAPGYLPSNVHGVTSTAPCPAQLIRGLRTRGLARMTEVYGSSETAGIGWRDDPDGAYRLLGYWDVGEDGLLVRTDPQGRRRAPLDPPDVLEWQAGGFVVRGRHDLAVQVGGVNVYPGQVAEMIRSHPLVAECEVRLMRPEEGQRLKAFIVLDVPVDGLDEEPANQAQPELDVWLADSLSAPERPRALTFGRALPRDAQGKVADWS